MAKRQRKSSGRMASKGAYTFTNGSDTVTVFSNAEVVHAQILSS
jgi:hypothetical protein